LVYVDHYAGVAIAFLGACAAVALGFALVTIVRKRLGRVTRSTGTDGQPYEEDEDDE
jgi:hypothetical protein